MEETTWLKSKPRPLVQISPKASHRRLHRRDLARACRRTGCLAGALRHPRFSRSTRIAAIITGRSRKDSWSATAFAAPGITPVSICAAAKRRRAPALSPLAVWQVEHEGDRLFVRRKREQPKPRGKAPVDAPGKIVIVGGGAAGFAAAEMLRRQEFRGSIVMLSNDAAPPVDRPNLSKDYLAGSAPEDWMPLRPDEFLRGGRHRSAAQQQCHLDRHQGAQCHHRRWRHDCLRPAAAGDGRRAGAAADSRRRPAARPYAALACRLPRDHRIRQRRAPRDRDRRQLHRARGRGGAARARHRGPRGGAGTAADGARARAGNGRFRARIA